jgi:hypothetical protein
MVTAKIAFRIKLSHLQIFGTESSILTRSTDGYIAKASSRPRYHHSMALLKVEFGF